MEHCSTNAAIVNTTEVFIGTMESSVANAPEVPPASFKLENAYPNPFSQNTSFSLNLPQTSSLKVVVYDLLGRQVDIVFEGIKEKGVHNLVWTPHKLAQGSYILSIESKEFHTSQMLVLKSL